MPTTLERRSLAEAVFHVVGTRGADAASFADVAARAGVPVARIRRYCRTTDDLLLFALDQLGARVAPRLARRLAALHDPDPREILYAAMTELLPITVASRQEARVALAFLSRATVTPTYGATMREGYARILGVATGQLGRARDAGLIAADCDPGREAATLLFLTQGLAGPILLGHCPAEEAMRILDRQLDRLFGDSGRGQGAGTGVD